MHYETEEAAKQAIERVDGMQIGEKTVGVGGFLKRSDREKPVNNTFTNARELRKLTSHPDFTCFHGCFQQLLGLDGCRRATFWVGHPLKPGLHQELPQRLGRGDH